MTFWVTPQCSSIPDNNCSWTIFGGCGGCVRMQCAITRSLDPLEKSWERAVLSCGFQTLWKLHENGVCFYMVFGTRRVHRRAFSSHFTNEDLMQPGAASGRLQRPVNRKRTQPEIKWCMANPGDCCTVGAIMLFPKVTFWVAAVVPDLKSRPRPRLQAQHYCWVPMFRGGLDEGWGFRIFSLLFRGGMGMICQQSGIFLNFWHAEPHHHWSRMTLPNCALDLFRSGQSPLVCNPFVPIE